MNAKDGREQKKLKREGSLKNCVSNSGTGWVRLSWGFQEFMERGGREIVLQKGGDSTIQERG